MICHDAVFVYHGHDVGGYGHGHQVKHPFEFARADAVAYRECLHQLVSHAAARQVAARVCRAFELWVEYGYSVRQHLIGDMVVADDEIDAEGLGVSDFGVGLDAAVKDDDELDAGGGSFVYGVCADAVAFVVTCRNVVVDFRVKFAGIGIPTPRRWCRRHRNRRIPRYVLLPPWPG